MLYVELINEELLGGNKHIQVGDAWCDGSAQLSPPVT
jgi:hypothetical protein